MDSIPILTITLQIPVLPDTTIHDVLDAFVPQLQEALGQIKAQAYSNNSGKTHGKFSAEQNEPLAPEHKVNIIKKLGYRDIN